MKLFKKVLTFVLVAIMTVAMGATNVFAEGNTISVDGAKNGEKYNIYKMLDLEVNDQTTPTAFRYTTNPKWAGFWTDGAGKDYVTIATDGSVKWNTGMDTAAKMEEFGKAAAAYAETNSILPDKPEVTAANDKAEWTGLDNGYYLVTSTFGTAVSVASTPSNPEQKISEKNTDDSSDKEVQEAAERNGTPKSWPADKANDAAIGDTIEFRAKITIAKNTTGLVYHDTMTSGLTWSGVANTKVYSDADLTTEIPANSYTVAAGTAPETFTVTFAETYLAGLTATTTEVWVGYSAVLNDNAKVATGEVNTGKITWGNNGQGKPTTTNTTTHKFSILKYDGADADKNPLAGAKFKLFTVEEEGTALKLAKNAAGTVYRVVDMSDSGATLPEGFTLVEDDKIVTLATNAITIEGVDSDDYYLEETDAPRGYNPISGRKKITVDAANNLMAEVPNESGSQLPSTGGIGTTIFYVLGGLLVAGAGIVLVARRKASE